jgi:hypothetical protein
VNTQPTLSSGGNSTLTTFASLSALAPPPRPIAPYAPHAGRRSCLRHVPCPVRRPALPVAIPVRCSLRRSTFPLRFKVITYVHLVCCPLTPATPRSVPMFSTARLPRRGERHSARWFVLPPLHTPPFTQASITSPERPGVLRSRVRQTPFRACPFTLDYLACPAVLHWVVHREPQPPLRVLLPGHPRLPRVATQHTSLRLS